MRCTWSGGLHLFFCEVTAFWAVRNVAVIRFEMKNAGHFTFSKFLKFWELEGIFTKTIVSLERPVLLGNLSGTG